MALAAHPLLADTAYVPYTPRQQRPPKPGLRAAAQSIGLGPTSLGLAMLERIAHEGDDWAEIWHALTRARATLLLPASPAGPDPITPDFVHDHLVLVDRHDSPALTLSGLRGHLARDTLTVRSTLHPASKPFRALLASPAALGALPPLPAYPPESSYPSFAVSAFAPVLSLPARPTKPPLPPRPGLRGPPPSSARLPLPFASLFGQRPSTPPPAVTSTPTAPPPTPADADPTVDISALVIDAPLSRADIATAILAALNGEIAIALADQPPWLVERVHAFAQAYLPFVRLPAGKKKLQDIGGNPNRVVYAINSALDKPDDLADKFQAFYRAIEVELRQEGASDANEAWIRDILETIESTLCTLLYDRLFLPSTSDDPSHNEALSSRVAALNMLDLGLEHLDIDIGDANRAEVDAVVHTCGQTLARLDTARSPREKAAVLVSAHKLIVEGLSKIPPIRLKSDTKAHGSEVPTAEPPTSPSRTTASDQQTVSEPPLSEVSPVSGDVLLPILIFSVVKANPSRLVSHLLYTQRFRNQSFGGEESYCLINLMAVAEFLENVDLGALGLGESENKVLSTANLTPIPIARSSGPDSPIALVAVPGDEHPASLRGRVEQGVDAIAGNANKVISGVVDSSFGVLRALMPGQRPAGPTEPTQASSVPGGGAGTSDTDRWGVRPSLGLLGRETGFSIAGLTAALPGAGLGPARAARSQGHPEEQSQRELVEVSASSRPASLKSHWSGYEEENAEDEEKGEGGDEGSNDDKGEEGEEEEGEEEEGGVHDTRSIKSFESMLSSGRTRRQTTVATVPSASSESRSMRRQRLSDLTDRLAYGVAGMSRRVQGGGGDGYRAPTLSGRIMLPNRRFLECTEQDIRVSEVGELLREYQRLVEAVRSVGGFQE